MVTKLINEITNFHQRPDESLYEAWECYKLSIDRCPNHNMLPVTQINTFYNGLTLRHRDTINAAAGETFMKRHPEECYDLIKNMTAHHNDWDTSAQRSESSSSITSSSDTEITTLKAEMAEINKNLMRVLQVNQQVKAVTPSYETCGRQTQNIPQPQVVTTNEFTNFMKANDVILKNMQTNMTSLTNKNLELKNMFGQFMKMNTASSLGSGTLPGNTITNPKEELKGIITHSGTAYQRPMIPTTCSFLPPTESPILNSEPVVAPIIEPISAPPWPISAQASISCHCRVEQLSLPELTPTLMTLELADRSISRPIGVAEDVYVKTGRALIDVFEGELTLRVGKEAITFNLDQTSRYSANYNDMTANQIDVIDMACEEYSQEVLGFTNVIASGNPTPYYDPIVSTTSLTLTPFGISDFLIEEVDAFLALEDDPTLPEVD
nr:reverse transcriptase domain-containing protein [Tanacetum cinerariifolium]